MSAQVLNRAQAIEAVQAGKQVERSLPAREVATPLRWCPDNGFQVYSEISGWVNETGSPRHIYQLAFSPRIFDGVWEEVESFKDAQPGGSLIMNGEREALKLRVCEEGPFLESCASNTKLPGYWVKYRGTR